MCRTRNSARDWPRRWQVRPGWRSWVITAGLGDRAEFLDVVGRAVEFETRDRLVVEIPETSALIDAAEPLLPTAWRHDRMVLEMGSTTPKDRVIPRAVVPRG